MTMDLQGIRVAVTRPRRSGEGGEDALAGLLRRRGARPVHYPVTRILPPDDPEPLLHAVERIEAYDWIVLTSARAVAPLVEALDRGGSSTGAVRRAGVRVCAVGPRTAQALLMVGLPADLVPDRFVAEGLIDAFLADVNPEGLRILLPRAQEGRALFVVEMEAAGARVDVVPTYRAEAVPEEASRLAEAVAANELDVLTFTAGSTVRSFADAWNEDGAPTPLPEAMGVVAIGPATADTVTEEGWRVHAVAEPHTLDGLVHAVQTWAESRQEG